MGSGETAPTMAKVHRQLFARLGRAPIPAVLLDTPYGFQENADEITERALDYFRDNVGFPMTLAPFRSARVRPARTSDRQSRAPERRTTCSRVPAVPATRWRSGADTELPSIVADKLARGGIVVFASAAALTLGSHTVPVYEIYKVGRTRSVARRARPARPRSVCRWPSSRTTTTPRVARTTPASATSASAGWRPSSRCCPTSHFVLGVDSHTALVLDLAAGAATVLGLGSVTVRVAGRSEVFEAGTSLPISGLGEAARRLRGATVDSGMSESSDRRPTSVAAPARSPLDQRGPGARDALRGAAA